MSAPDPLGSDATVRFVDVEGGCWVLITANGTSFEPTALPARYQQDGLNVHFSYEPRNDAGSICMVGGEIIEITSIETR